MRYRVTGKDEKTGEESELYVDAPDREAALAEAARLGLIGENAFFEALPPEADSPPVRYGALRFCAMVLIVLACIQVVAGALITLQPRQGFAGLIIMVGAVVPAAFGFACLALRDIAIHTVPVSAVE